MGYRLTKQQLLIIATYIGLYMYCIYYNYNYVVNEFIAS